VRPEVFVPELQAAGAGLLYHLPAALAAAPLPESQAYSPGAPGSPAGSSPPYPGSPS